MPIDYLTQSNSKEQMLKNLLNQRMANIDPNLAATRARIMAGRQPVFSQLNSSLPGLDPSLTSSLSPSLASKTPILDRQTDSLLGRQGMELKQGVLGLQGQDLEASLGRSQELQRGAVDYSRQYARQGQLNQFAASEAAKKRKGALQIEDIKDQALRSMILLDQSFMPSDDNSSALFRELFRAGTGFGTAYALRNKPTINPDTPAPIASQQPYGPNKGGAGMYPRNVYR